VHWLSPNTGATNESGFTALPGCDACDAGHWWSATAIHSDDAIGRKLSFDVSNVIRAAFAQRYEYSVRCLEGDIPSITNSIISEEVILYPNPATEKLYINNSNYANSTILIFDIQGNLILSKQMDSNPIDISGLEKGIYVVKLVGSENVLITKFIKE
jgi:hypothetical protein